MGYAVNSAETSSHDPAKLSKAGELADGQYSERALRNPPSLQALKLQDVLMKNAGGKIADDQWHELPLATFKQVKGFRNLTHEDVVRLFEELRSVTIRHVNNAEGVLRLQDMRNVYQNCILASGDEGKKRQVHPHPFLEISLPRHLQRRSRRA